MDDQEKIHRVLAEDDPYRLRERGVESMRGHMNGSGSKGG